MDVHEREIMLLAYYNCVELAVHVLDNVPVSDIAAVSLLCAQTLQSHQPEQFQGAVNS